MTIYPLTPNILIELIIVIVRTLSIQYFHFVSFIVVNFSFIIIFVLRKFWWLNLVEALFPVEIRSGIVRITDRLSFTNIILRFDEVTCWFI